MLVSKELELGFPGPFLMYRISFLLPAATLSLPLLNRIRDHLVPTLLPWSTGFLGDVVLPRPQPLHTLSLLSCADYTSSLTLLA